ncbi:hypothetical protein KAK07_25000 [Ideonella sp. 4Y16]|uniref:hypothetical protein n=1 Tax=Ideonella alba TaxID=2824118 RepID=UPI001B359D45|nr:hypothetical protein [Ideonella alba]MBQ0946608.1 hypothetical protein [Ideonella alba]
MRDILPSEVINLLRDRYSAGVANAEAFFDQHRADEDSVTGALGQALAVVDPIRYVSAGQQFEIRVGYRKIRGRGPGAPERSYGSDGIFQISIHDEAGNVALEKGLAFQSKMNWKGKNQSLLGQAALMEKWTPGGIVIDFSATGYKACTAQATVAASGSRRALDRYGAMRPLSQVLSRDFLDCTVGRRGLYFDPNKEWYVQRPPLDHQLLHVVSTEVTIRPWG